MVSLPNHTDHVQAPLAVPLDCVVIRNKSVKNGSENHASTSVYLQEQGIRAPFAEGSIFRQTE